MRMPMRTTCMPVSCALVVQILEPDSTSMLLRLFLLMGMCVVTGAASAQSVGLGLANANNCMSCHRVDRKVVGPGFSAIAERFAGNSEAAEYLANSIVNGSRRKWGPVPMPRQAHVSPEDAHTIAEWILTLHEPDPKSE